MSSALILGLDGATLQVLEPLMAAGRLPHLAAWSHSGEVRPLTSTLPAMSFPAWSTFATGLFPGQHGLFDFTQKLPGAYRVRFVNATDRRGTSMMGRASRAGRCVLALGIPATFPPEPLTGLLVGGFDSPISAGSDASSASDPALYREIAERVGDWMRPDLDERARGEGWHERAVEHLLARIERKTAFAVEALARLRHRRGQRPELAVVVFSESDTVAHHYWRDHDPRSPRHDPAASATRRGALARVYERLDAACGEIRAAYGEDAACAVVSDHGSGGASRRVVHLGRRLQECALLRRSSAPVFERAARSARDLALRALPPRAAQLVFRHTRGAAARVESAVRFGGFDWKRSAAFCEDVNTQPGVWINLRGREAAGSVHPSDYERVRSQVIDCLLDWKLPGGAAIVARARPREAVYSGPCADRAPDVVVELDLDAGYGLSLVPTPWQEPRTDSVRELSGDELGGGRGRGMNGTHRPDGVWISTGPEAGRLRLGPEPSLADVAPAVLRHLGVAPDDGEPAQPTPQAYGPEEEARVADRLRALGYLE